jgi:hypothetical protein
MTHGKHLFVVIDKAIKETEQQAFSVSGQEMAHI